MALTQMGEFCVRFTQAEGKGSARFVWQRDGLGPVRDLGPRSSARTVGLKITGGVGLRPGWLRGRSVAERDDAVAEGPGFEELERHLAGASFE